MDSYVFRPMMTGHPIVVRLKNFRSSEICHRRALSRPMALLSAIATIMHFSIFVWVWRPDQGDNEGITQLLEPEFGDMDRNRQVRNPHT